MPYKGARGISSTYHAIKGAKGSGERYPAAKKSSVALPAPLQRSWNIWMTALFVSHFFFSWVIYSLKYITAGLQWGGRTQFWNCVRQPNCNRLYQSTHFSIAEVFHWPAPVRLASAWHSWLFICPKVTLTCFSSSSARASADKLAITSTGERCRRQKSCLQVSLAWASRAQYNSGMALLFLSPPLEKKWAKKKNKKFAGSFTDFDDMCWWE